jgi:hypothetical protein
MGDIYLIKLGRSAETHGELWGMWRCWEEGKIPCGVVYMHKCWIRLTEDPCPRLQFILLFHNSVVHAPEFTLIEIAFLYLRRKISLGVRCFIKLPGLSDVEVVVAQKTSRREDFLSLDHIEDLYVADLDICMELGW